jgi:hypothetical protein
MAARVQALVLGAQLGTAQRLVELGCGDSSNANGGNPIYSLAVVGGVSNELVDSPMNVSFGVTAAAATCTSPSTRVLGTVVRYPSAKAFYAQLCSNVSQPVGAPLAVPVAAPGTCVKVPVLAGCGKALTTSGSATYSSTLYNPNNDLTSLRYSTTGKAPKCNMPCGPRSSGGTCLGSGKIATVQNLLPPVGLKPVLIVVACQKSNLVIAPVSFGSGARDVGTLATDFQKCVAPPRQLGCAATAQQGTFEAELYQPQPGVQVRYAPPTAPTPKCNTPCAGGECTIATPAAAGAVNVGQVKKLTRGQTALVAVACKASNVKNADGSPLMASSGLFDFNASSFKKCVTGATLVGSCTQGAADANGCATYSIAAKVSAAATAVSYAPTAAAAQCGGNCASAAGCKSVLTPGGGSVTLDNIPAGQSTFVVACAKSTFIQGKFVVSEPVQSAVCGQPCTTTTTAAAATGGSSHKEAIGLGVGLGLGIPLLGAAAFFLGFRRSVAASRREMSPADRSPMPTRPGISDAPAPGSATDYAPMTDDL